MHQFGEIYLQWRFRTLLGSIILFSSSFDYSRHQAVNFIIAFTTPLFLSRSSSGPYFLFGAFSLLTTFVCLAFQPESRGISLEGLDDVFANSPWEKMVKNLKSGVKARRRLADEIIGEGNNLDVSGGRDVDIELGEIVPIRFGAGSGNDDCAK